MGRSARPSLKRQWPGWAPGVGSDGAAGKCQSIPEGIRRRRTITMRWRWTTPKTRGAAPRTRTPRARRSPRMEIAQVRDPAGWDPESSRQASDRPLSTRRAAASCWESGEGREGRGGDWLPALRGTRTVRWALPGSWRVPVDGAGRGRARAWTRPAPVRCAVLLAVRPALGTSG